MRLVDRPLQLGGPFKPLRDRLLQGGPVHLVTSFALTFGCVHRDVGRLDEVGRRLASSRAKGDADADVHLDIAVGDLHGHAQLVDKALRQPAGLVGLGGLLQQDCELVAAEAGGGVADSQRPDEALGDRDEYLVAGSVPEAVVDELEVVEVEKQNGERGPRPGGPRRCMLEAVAEKRPVGETAQCVVESLVLELFL